MTVLEAACAAKLACQRIRAGRFVGYQSWDICRYSTKNARRRLCIALRQRFTAFPTSFFASNPQPPARKKSFFASKESFFASKEWRTAFLPPRIASKKWWKERREREALRLGGFKRIYRGAGHALRALRAGGAPHHGSPSDPEIDGPAEGHEGRRVADRGALSALP